MKRKNNMGVDFEAVAGYGVRIKNNLTTKGQEIRAKYEDDYSFVEKELGDFHFDMIGDEYSGDTELILCSANSDVLKYRDEFETFKSKLIAYSDIILDVEPKWYCELYVS